MNRMQEQGMKATPTQLPLSLADLAPAQPVQDQSRERNDRINRVDVQDRAFHDWYRFILSFPPHLVQDYIADFDLSETSLVLDPFCGTGTTLVEARLNGIPSVGLEVNPFAAFASTVKVDWGIAPDDLAAAAREIAGAALNILRAQGIEDSQPFAEIPRQLKLRTLSPDTTRLLLTNSISPLPLHKTLVLVDCLGEHKAERYYSHALLALANALVFKISNLHFGPEVGCGRPKKDVPVVACWLSEVDRMAQDLQLVRDRAFPRSDVHLADARQPGKVLQPNSIDAVITSPPYPNEKDYTRTTRLESVLLGFIRSRAELREMKKGFIRSNTRGVYKGDDDDRWVSEHPEVQRIADAIEQRRLELAKNSGFERLYGRVTRLYFGGMARHLADLRNALRPGAHLAYVVGDQASYLRVMIRTGQLLADIAQALGYELVRTDLFRTRFATATREQLREEVVVLRWKG
jgi:hypothetical protein